MNCTAATGCHFCATDMKCHVFGSPYGCTFDADCQDLKSCIRSAPQFKGYASPPTVQAAVLISTALLLVLILSLCSIFACWLRHKRMKKVSPCNLVVNDKLVAQDYLELDMRAQDKEPASLRPPPRSRGPKRRPTTYCCFQLCVFISVVCILVGMFLGLWFLPQEPSYSLCSRNTDWSGILGGIISGKVRADVEMLFSVYNPNRFAAEITSATVYFSWKGEEIGLGTLEATTFPGGSVVDFILRARFTPGVTTASQMLTAHYAGALLLDVDMEMASSVRFFDNNALRYDFLTNQTAQNIDISAANDRALCLCR